MFVDIYVSFDFSNVILIHKLNVVHFTELEILYPAAWSNALKWSFKVPIWYIQIWPTRFLGTVNFRVIPLLKTPLVT